MIAAREACLALAGAHELLNAAKAEPARLVDLPGARLQIRAGHDAAYPSTNSNRLMVYAPGAGDLAETMARAREEFAAARVTHWFAKIGPGVHAAQVMAGMARVGARVWPDVQYPAMARAAGVMERPATTLRVQRVGRAEIAARMEELVSVFDATGAANFLSTAGREGFAHVLGFDGERPVAGGMLAMSGKTGYLCFGVTHPEFRGRGGQSAIIAERVNIAHERGCTMCLSETVSFLTTSLNNLRRAGFARVFDWTVLEVGFGGGKG